MHQQIYFLFLLFICKRMPFSRSVDHSQGGYTETMSEWVCLCDRAGEPVSVWFDIVREACPRVQSLTGKTIKYRVSDRLMFQWFSGYWGGHFYEFGVEQIIMAVWGRLCFGGSVVRQLGGWVRCLHWNQRTASQQLDQFVQWCFN